MKDETDCECLISQVNALKSIIDETGKGFLSQAEIDFLSTKSVGIIEKSLDRIDGLEKMKLEEAEDEDEQFDDNDLDLIKEEGQNEYDLQLAAAELMGCLFKTHPDMVSELVKKLRTETLAAAFASGT
jgi:importin-5